MIPLSIDDIGNICEIFSSFQGEGPLIGKKQVFVRTAGCNLNCSYCDTPMFRRDVEFCRVMDLSVPGRFRQANNPVTSSWAMKEILDLWTIGTHSVSITGGEPLCQPEFSEALTMGCAAEGLPVYFETNGFSESRFSRLIDWIDFAAIDIKLPSHGACPPSEWKTLIENEIACIEGASRAGVATIVKMVILDSTSAEEIKILCLRLEGLDITLVLQPASGESKPDREKLMLLHKAASEHLGEVVVIPQAHKIMGVL